MPGPAALRLVTVDITNTMIRIVGSPGKQYALVAARHGIHGDEQELNKAFLKHYKKYCQCYPNFGASCSMPASHWWTGVVTETFQDVGIPSSLVLNEVARDLFLYFATGTPWEILPGSEEALRQLRQFEVKLGVISNFDHRLCRILRDLNLRRYFDFVLPSYIVGAEKPSAAIFRRALEDAGGGCTAEEAVHFGDNAEKDFRGARNVGMGAYLLDTKRVVVHEGVDEKFVVRTAGEFVRAIMPRLIRKGVSR